MTGGTEDSQAVDLAALDRLELLRDQPVVAIGLEAGESTLNEGYQLVPGFPPLQKLLRGRFL